MPRLTSRGASCPAPPYRSHDRTGSLMSTNVGDSTPEGNPSKPQTHCCLNAAEPREQISVRGTFVARVDQLTGRTTV